MDLKLAGVRGIEPRAVDLETTVLPLHYTPIKMLPWLSTRRTGSVAGSGNPSALWFRVERLLTKQLEHRILVD